MTVPGRPPRIHRKLLWRHSEQNPQCGAGGREMWSLGEGHLRALRKTQISVVILVLFAFFFLKKIFF